MNGEQHPETQLPEAVPAQEGAAPARTDREENAAPEPETAEDPLATLAAELDRERAQRMAAEDRELRWRADFENLRRRTLLEAEQVRHNLIQEVVGRLLPALDDLDRALATAGEGTPPSWAQGIEMVRRRFLAGLGEIGLSRMACVGRPFDPERHEAMSKAEDSGLPANTVVEELRPGYLLGTRVVRPALVKVQA